MLWVLGAGGHSCPLPWRISLIPLSASLGTHNQWLVTVEYGGFTPLPQGGNTHVVPFPLQSHLVGLSWGCGLAVTSALHFSPCCGLLPSFLFSQKHSLNKSFAAASPKLAQPLLLGNPTEGSYTPHGKWIGAGEDWQQEDKVEGSGRNPAEPHRLFPVRLWNSMTLSVGSC